MAVNFANYQAFLQCVETPTPLGGLPTGQQITHQLTGSGFTTNSLQLTTTSTPAVSGVASGNFTLSSGALTVDLTNLNGPVGAVTLTGLKLQVIEIFCPATNTNSVQFAKGATNGYAFDLTGGVINVTPGGHVLIYLAGGAGAIGSSAKTIDVSSSMNTALFTMILAAG